MPSSYLTGFAPDSKSQWEKRAIGELSGKASGSPFPLKWNASDEVVLDPYYTAADLKGIPLAAIQSAQKQLPGWQNRVSVPVIQVQEARELAHEAMAGGADAIDFSFPDDDLDVDLAQLLKGIDPAETPVYFSLNELNQALSLADALRKSAPFPLKGGIFCSSPRWVEKALTERLQGGNASPDFKLLRMDAKRTNESFSTGKGDVQTPSLEEELTHYLLTLVSLLDQRTDQGESVPTVIPRLEISLSLQSDYYLEIAKIRTLRYLIAQVQRAYGMEQPIPVFIHAFTTFPVPNRDRLEPISLPGASLQSMAALCGGVDALTVTSDQSVSPDAFSRRIARNMSNILKEEAQFARVADPGAGSYFLEKLTWELSQAVWGRFLKGVVY